MNYENEFLRIPKIPIPDLYVYTRNFIDGYTKGFNDSLKVNNNQYPLPESDWKPDEAIAIKKMRQEQLEKYNSSGILPDEIEEFHNRYEDGKKPQHYKIGYNWGLMHGSETRDELKSQLRSEIFDECMLNIAICIENILQQNNRSYTYPYRFYDPDPEKEKIVRQNIIADLLPPQVPFKAQAIELEKIDSLLKQKKLQRAIDQGMQLFKERKAIEEYARMLQIKFDFKKLKDDSKFKRITKEEYRGKIPLIEKAIIDLLAGIRNNL